MKKYTTPELSIILLLRRKNCVRSRKKKWGRGTREEMDKHRGRESTLWQLLHPTLEAFS